MEKEKINASKTTNVEEENFGSNFKTLTTTD